MWRGQAAGGGGSWDKGRDWSGLAAELVPKVHGCDQKPGRSSQGVYRSCGEAWPHGSFDFR